MQNDALSKLIHPVLSPEERPSKRRPGRRRQETASLGDRRKKERDLAFYHIPLHPQDGTDTGAEDIEESFDDLLIFPTKEGLRVTTRMITSYFQLEVETMKQYV